MKQFQQQKGFTLVELAIVLTIVGLLIGGILKGQQLISNAKVTSQMAQMKAVEAAITTFGDTFGGLPGDLLQALARLPANSCGAAACVNGDGNGQVGLPVAAPATPANETLHFWNHMSGANLISGISSQAVQFGGGIPQGKIAGGLGAFTSNGTAPFLAGLSVASATLTTFAAAAAGTGVMTPNQAAQIDRKSDDGNPLTGEVAHRGAGTCIVAGPPAAYNEAITSKDCNLVWRLQP